MSKCGVCKKREGKIVKFDIDLPNIIICDVCLFNGLLRQDVPEVFKVNDKVKED